MQQEELVKSQLFRIFTEAFKAIQTNDKCNFQTTAYSISTWHLIRLQLENSEWLYVLKQINSKNVFKKPIIVTYKLFQIQRLSWKTYGKIIRKVKSNGHNIFFL